MNSGIYKITFSSQHFYIGKSENISRRWQTHAKNFLEHKHTKRMQWAYDNYGTPEYQVLLPTHPDHIGIYEGIIIHELWCDHILNTTRPPQLAPEVASRYLEIYSEVTLEGKSALLSSTLQHLEAIRQEFLHNKQLQTRLDQFTQAGIVLEPEVDLKIKTLESQLQQQREKLDRYKNLTLWQRIFAYRV